MLGMESLLANMLGVTPEQMQQTIHNAVTLLSDLDTRLSNIEKMVADIHTLDFGPTANATTAIVHVETEPVK